jgi:hypothetical protein
MGEKLVVGKVLGREVSREELLAAFGKVEPLGNWKLPVNAVVELEEDELPMVNEAVIFFTGSVPKFLSKGGKTYRVQAVGYYNAIGA